MVKACRVSRNKTCSAHANPLFRMINTLPSMPLVSPYPGLKKINRLPSPPGVAMRILRLVDSEDATIEQLTEVISTDPVLTSKVLKFMNSPIVGAGYQGATLGEAIARIGMRGAKLMALSFSLISRQEGQVCSSFDFSRFWSESLARAVAARSLSQSARVWNVEDAFITALVCEIGKLVYATGMPAEYEPVLSGTVRPELSLRERERVVLGADRFEIGMCLLKDWQLPENVWKTVGRLGAGRESKPGVEESILEAAQSVAEFICNKDRHNAEELETLSGAVAPVFEMDREVFTALLKTIGEEWIGYGRLLSVPTETLPDFRELEKEAEEHRTALRLATEVEVKELRTENEQLSHLARRDRLTGLCNRGAFDSALPEAVEAASRNDGSLALLMIDADRFKSINDAHGHPAGDAVLRHLARVISDNVRRRDEVFRYGGEEFVVIAADLTLEAAEILAENIRAAVETSPCVGDCLNLPVTVSLGVAWASWPADGKPGDALLQVADERLYDAKRDGRNRWKSRSPKESTGSGVFSKLGRLFGSRSK